MNLTDLLGHDLRLSATLARTWRQGFAAVVLVLAALAAGYWESVVTLVDTWQRSGTYTHGFVVFPISAWLIWRGRADLANMAPHPFLPGIAVLAGLSLLWLLGHLASIQTFQEFALVASVPMVLWTVLGTQFASRFAFALGFMMFAWPFGEFLIPPLIDRTADFTVAALRLTGVPVFRQGNSFSIPTGEWSVIDACSGVRYLLASICGGAAFAYLTYHSARRRLIFMVAAVAVPIVANWFRAYLIVLLGHLSNNRLAAGVDHLLYGWVFFGLVMLILFYVGGLWTETKPPEAAAARPVSRGSQSAKRTGLIAAAAALAAIAIGPSIAFALRNPEPVKAAQLAIPAAPSPWQAVPGRLTTWQPAFKNPTAKLRQTYRNEAQQVQLAIDVYAEQRARAKLLTFTSTTLSDYDADWKTSGRKLVSVPNGPPSNVIERRVQSRTQNLIVWQWYWINGVQTTSVWRAKLAQLEARIHRRGDAAAGITLIAEYGDDPAQAQQTLRELIGKLGSEVDASIAHALAP